MFFLSIKRKIFSFVRLLKENQLKIILEVSTILFDVKALSAVNFYTAPNSIY